MLKLPPLPPIVITSVMYLVLFAMLGLSIPSISNTPPYTDLNQCLLRNIAQQNVYNADMLKELMYEERSFYSAEISIKANLVHNKTLVTIAALESIEPKLQLKDAGINIPASILGNVAEAHTFFGQQVKPTYRNFALKLLLTNSENIKSVFTHWHRLSFENKKTLLYAIQNLVLLSEWQALWELYIESSGCILFIEPFEMIAIPVKGWYYAGEKLTARIMLATYNKAITPTVMPKKGWIERVENGVAEWAYKSDVLGRVQVTGKISIDSPVSIRIEKQGEKPKIITRPWSFEYTVIAPGVSISVDNMHVLYAGIANAISVSAPGYSADKVTLRVPGAKVEKLANGQYEVRVPANIKTLTAYLDAENINGEVSTLEGMQLKIKPLPPPAITLDDKPTGNMPAGVLHKPLQLNALPADEDIDMQYTIEGFEYTLLQYGSKTAAGPYAVTGNTLPQIQDAAAGDRLVISNIVCRDTRGNEVQPSSISYLLQ